MLKHIPIATLLLVCACAQPPLNTGGLPATTKDLRCGSEFREAIRSFPSLTDRGDETYCFDQKQRFYRTCVVREHDRIGGAYLYSTEDGAFDELLTGLTKQLGPDSTHDGLRYEWHLGDPSRGPPPLPLALVAIDRTKQQTMMVVVCADP